MSDASEVKKNIAATGSTSGVGQSNVQGGFVVGPNGSATKVTDTFGKSGASRSTQSGLKSSNAQNQPRFRSEKIGEWAARQEGYFAEQNRKAAEKRRLAEQKRRQALPVIFGVGGALVAILVIWGIVRLPEAVQQLEERVP